MMRSQNLMPTRYANLFLSFAVCMILCGGVGAQQKRASKTRSGETASTSQKPNTQQTGGAPSADELNDELDTISVKKPVERIAALKEFLQYEAPREVLLRAKELLIGAHAALGDEKLRAGDVPGGVAEFREAVRLAPSKQTEKQDKLFNEIVVQLPANLFLRGETTAAVDLAHSIEAKATGNPQRLLAIAIFYIGVEQDAEAARVANEVIKLAPNMSEAYQTLGAAYRIGLRLEDAAQSYARAHELDPKASNARLNLADLKRALGRPNEALALYREQLAAAPADELAQSGVILSLLDLGNEAEARTELHAALQKNRKNLALLVGAAYWFAAHNDFNHAYELAQQAVRVEPRYTWGHIALARSLIGLKDPPAAERSLRYAQQFGHFPTLSYELANALAANGFYDEAAEELAHSFAIQNEQIATKLAGRQIAQAASFVELLAPERRAAIFQPVAADTDVNARRLKSLLAFYLATTASAANGGVELNDALAATDFVAGDDAMSAFRQKYVANRLLSLNATGRNFAARAFELTESAIRGAEAAINSPAAPTAILAEDLRDERARAIAQGALPETPALPRQMLSNIFRGGIEDTAGWALFLDNKPSEAIVRLKRAVSVLPRDSALWRNSLWHLGAALEATGNNNDALNAYLKSYDPRDPNPARRAIIEASYKRAKGTLDGLDALIGEAPTQSGIAANTAPSSVATSPTATTNQATSSSTPRAARATSPVAVPRPILSTPTMPEVALDSNTNSSPKSTSFNEPPPQAVNSPSSDAKTSIEPSVPTPPAPRNERPRRAKRNDGAARVDVKCMMLSASEIEIEKPGGSATITINLSGDVKATDVRPETPNWSDIMVLEQPSNSNNNAVVFLVSSISQRGGVFKVTFKSPCGGRDVNVNVKDNR